MSQQLCESSRIRVSSLSRMPSNSAKSVQQNEKQDYSHVEARDKQEECINGYSLLCQRYIMQPKTSAARLIHFFH